MASVTVLDMPLPKYHRVYLRLKERLREGDFADGLPGELALMKQFDVSRVTVRKALELLSQEGLVVRQPGRRTRLAGEACPPAPGAGAQGRRTSLLDNLVNAALGTRIKVLDVEVAAAAPAVARALSLADGALVQKAVRVRSNRQGPLSHITTYVPATLASHFGRRELGSTPLLVLLEKTGLQLGRAQQFISARLADADIAQALQVPVGSALLAVRRLVFDANERPIQWLHGLYRPDRYEYEIQLSRVGDMDARVWVSNNLTPPFR